MLKGIRRILWMREDRKKNGGIRKASSRTIKFEANEEDKAQLKMLIIIAVTSVVLLVAVLAGIVLLKNSRKQSGETMETYIEEEMEETTWDAPTEEEPQTIEETTAVEETTVEVTTVEETTEKITKQVQTTQEVTTQRKKKKKKKTKKLEATTVAPKAPEPEAKAKTAETKQVPKVTKPAVKKIGTYAESNALPAGKVNVLRSSVSVTGTYNTEYTNLARYMSVQGLSNAASAYHSLTGGNKSLSCKTFRLNLSSDRTAEMQKAAAKISATSIRASGYGIGICSKRKNVGYEVYIVVVYE